MKSEQYAEMARRWVRRAWVEAPPRPPADRRRLVGAVEQALRARARRRLFFHWGTGVGGLTLAAAAAVVLAPRLASFSTSAPTAPIAVSSQPGQPSTPSIATPAGAAPAANGPKPRTLTVLSATGDTRVATAAAAGSSSPASVAHGMTLEAGVELMAPQSGQIRIGTAEGTALTLEPGSRLTVSEDSATQRFALRRGAVRARVAKLHAGERFIINTSDAEIEVHGTAFRVALAESDPRCVNGSVTRVSVSEGVVTVTSRGRVSRLLPGDEWPKRCIPVASSAAASQPDARRALRRASFETRARVSGSSRARAVAAAAAATTDAPSPSGPAAPSALPPAPEASSPLASPGPATPAVPPSALAAQNDLFAAAVRAKRQGRASEAARLFAGLVQQYPSGPLVESALVQRMKLLAGVDPQAAADAARDYLARFPGGFARSEAGVLSHPAARP